MWVDTDFPYMIWEGDDAPNCPYCFHPLNIVDRKGVTELEYYPALDQLMQEHIRESGFYCHECGFPVDNHYNIGMMGINLFWIDELQAESLDIPYKEVK